MKIRSLRNVDWREFFSTGWGLGLIVVLTLVLIFTPVIYFGIQKGKTDRATEAASSQEIRGTVFNIVPATDMPTQGVTPRLVVINLDDGGQETFYVDKEEVILNLNEGNHYLLTVYTPVDASNPRRRISFARLLVTS
jgi:hypothetical protein